eukprot:scaffold106734_cov63-Phaeocystis_antarctica.AAC.5
MGLKRREPKIILKRDALLYYPKLRPFSPTAACPVPCTMSMSAPCLVGTVCLAALLKYVYHGCALWRWSMLHGAEGRVRPLRGMVPHLGKGHVVSKAVCVMSEPRTKLSLLYLAHRFHEARTNEEQDKPRTEPLAAATLWGQGAGSACCHGLKRTPRRGAHARRVLSTCATIARELEAGEAAAGRHAVRPWQPRLLAYTLACSSSRRLTQAPSSPLFQDRLSLARRLSGRHLSGQRHRCRLGTLPGGHVCCARRVQVGAWVHQTALAHARLDEAGTQERDAAELDGGLAHRLRVAVHRLLARQQVLHLPVHRAGHGAAVPLDRISELSLVGAVAADAQRENAAREHWRVGRRRLAACGLHGSRGLRFRE